MGFLHQLHLLLWKNVTLKRRSPWVLAFEIFIPLVLFFILLGLRQKKPTIPVKEVCKLMGWVGASPPAPACASCRSGGERAWFGSIHSGLIHTSVTLLLSSRAGEDELGQN
ncbi:ATP-binding cassette sub-family A member 2-like [Dryobates pubescens]|uniref:ATP-binding cassette sub-family A member 2-like n=1 Tax=Dryobates pubescens TaxID=118200 RepID=UPI0023B95B88|nr:ATP-binding cassette sub-family A member 2-like [Dryobates pubescens]